MKRHLFVLLIAVLAAGCASVAAFYPYQLEEEQIKKLLIGNWDGYIRRENSWVYFVNVDLTLRIFEISKERDGYWKINAVLNHQSLEYIELYIYNNTITIKMLSSSGGLFTLSPYGNTHLLGSVSYERGRWTPHNVVLKKISD